MLFRGAMSFVSTAVLAFSMSADAFAVSVGTGASMKKPSFAHALRTGVLFGTVEAVTPLIGWLAGLAASRFIQQIDHWVAFVILCAVGMKLLYEGVQEVEAQAVAPNKNPSFVLLLLTAIGTSIDAMAVGVTLALLPVNIWITAAAIGSATCVMVTLGIMTGHYIGCRVGKWAEILGGMALIGIGSSILLSHMGVL